MLYFEANDEDGQVAIELVELAICVGDLMNSWPRSALSRSMMGVLSQRMDRRWSSWW